ncbi:unnamed protein product [Owenia fusiformis]|uniref:Voltage-gated hydrogen channel 1 n=1 Tax=Owenia fusiformis TaxID=6347 RepID=A0A8S4NHM5_OWEFU|nr:unnamed protein product [Owenia fusiformis]
MGTSRNITRKQSKFQRFRDRLGHILHTHPALIVVCCLAICDVSFVVGQLICDLLIIREKLDQTDIGTQSLTVALKQRYSDDFVCYHGTSLNDLIDHVTGTTDHHLMRRALANSNQQLQKTNVSSSINTDNEHQDTNASSSENQGNYNKLQLEDGRADMNDILQLIDDGNVGNASALCGNNTDHHGDHSHDLLHELTHAFHLGSLTVLSIMVFEKILRLFAFGKYFFHSKLEVFDAFVVFTSWLLDIILIEGVWANSEVQAALLLVLLLPWRVIRIVNCFIMVFKEKYKIEIKMLASGKKQAEKKTVSIARQVLRYKSEIKALRGVCRKHGVDEETVGACHVKATKSLRRPKSSASNALLASSRIFLAAPLGQDPKSVEDLQGYESDGESVSNYESNDNTRGRSTSMDSVTLNIYAQTNNDSFASLKGLDLTYVINQHPGYREDYNNGRRDSFDGAIFWVDPEVPNTQENDRNYTNNNFLKNGGMYRDICNI